ncbi:MAG: DUF4159 domain-containing protein [Planctomycetes bacterium]|nr:DUF4159 domain-containing protein [Planctomycetota bacterium]
MIAKPCRPLLAASLLALWIAAGSAWAPPCAAQDREPDGADTTETTAEKLSMPRRPTDITDAHVRMSIDYGIRYLKSLQSRDGRIGTRNDVMNYSYPVGQTALALLAMLEGGLTLEDRNARAAYTYVAENPVDKTYEVALIAMVLAKLPKQQNDRGKQKTMEKLVARFADSQATDGMWTYWLLPPNKVPPREKGGWGRVVGSTWRGAFASGDNSNTQFAVLALWELAKYGIEIPEPTLRRAIEHYVRTQTAGGGWSYILKPEKYKHPEIHPSMSATGLASLYILRDLLGETGERKFNGTSSPQCGAAGKYDQAIEDAFNRVVRDLGVTNGLIELFGGPPFPRSGYYSYAVGRIGAAGGRKRLGDHDWYREGAWYFLKNQQRDGSWNTGYNEPIETSLAVLFLAKGRAPFIIHKLQWRGDWNRHPRDAANFVRYAENTFEQRFRWQIVGTDSEVEEWLEAPILFISGHESPRLFDEKEKKKLRQFVESGGTILADNCCKSKEFDEGFRGLMKDLFPETELRELQPPHRVFQSHFKLKPVSTHPLLGLDIPARGYGQAAGGKPPEPRTVVFYCPWTIGCVWNQNLKAEDHVRVFQVGINIFRYATTGCILKRPLDGTSKPIPVPTTTHDERKLSSDEEPDIK